MRINFAILRYAPCVLGSHTPSTSGRKRSIAPRFGYAIHTVDMRLTHRALVLACLVLLVSTPSKENHNKVYRNYALRVTHYALRITHYA
ncbi:MAG: hypothetical protein K2M64_03495, partial [Clostridia bacterium]|nr:hypothetical protein [Clostridia bacterium]